MTAALVTAALGVCAATPARHDDVIAFCKAHPDADFPNRAFFGSRYRPGATPRQLARLEDPLQWRCRDGRVLVCSDSADGDWCARKDASREPSVLLRKICREEPNRASFNFAEGHTSAYDWRCRQGTPLIVRGYALDRRGFFQAPWTPLIITRGMVTGPTEFPAGPR